MEVRMLDDELLQTEYDELLTEIFGLERLRAGVRDINLAGKGISAYISYIWIVVMHLATGQ
jgi:hypothetical protein